MTLNTQTLSSEKAIKQASPGFFKAPSFWKWEKRHTLLAIAFGCLILWWLSPRIKNWPLWQKGIEHLPTVGGLIFAADAVLKFAQ